MDELAAAAGVDPLDFRLAHLDNPRIRAVLEEAANALTGGTKSNKNGPITGWVWPVAPRKTPSWPPASRLPWIPPARSRCSTCAKCSSARGAESQQPPGPGARLHHHGLGPALREEMRFENGKMLNARFSQYAVPRFSDVPELDLHQLNRPESPSAGGGETPIIAIAPAIANAVHHATGIRIHEMPIRLPDSKTTGA